MSEKGKEIAASLRNNLDKLQKEGKGSEVAALFMTTESSAENLGEKVTEVLLSELHPFKDHPFQVKEDEELKQLAKSIDENGVVSPAIVRPCRDGGYELISGHRRKAACEMVGRIKMPVIVRKLDDDAATIIMVDSNKQRENLLPSEKAWAYKMRLDAMKRQGKRTDLTSRQVGEKLTSVSELSKTGDDSERTIQRFIRLTNLIPEFLKMVDEKKIAFNPAVELSYLPRKEQTALFDTMEAQQCTPSLSQAQQLKAMQQDGSLDSDTMLKVLSTQKVNQKEKIVFFYEQLKPFFPKGYTPQQIEKKMFQMLIDRQKKLSRQCNEPER